MTLDLVWAVLAGAVLSALADWLFTAVLMRERTGRTPELWRNGGQSQLFGLALLLALVTSASFVLLTWKLHQTDLRGALKLAAMVWAIGPLPLLVGNALAMRVDPVVTAAQAAGWLAKLLLIAAAAAWLL